MKLETAAEKMIKALGLEGKVENTFKATTTAKSTRKRGAVIKRDIAVTDEQVQNFRAAQGFTYFLQAPELFTPRVCKECDSPFLVSRKLVAFCSYDCIRANLNKMGFDWEKGRDLEALAQDPEVYKGNEPIILKNIKHIRHALEVLNERFPND